MFTLELVDGDFLVGNHGFGVAEGSDRVQQDLRCALLEPIGTDRFHPGYGSRLENFVGGPLGASLVDSVDQEVIRVVGNYVAVQRDRLERDAMSGDRSRFVTGDVIADVSNIRAEQVQDSVRIRVPITFADRSSVVFGSEVLL